MTVRCSGTIHKKGVGIQSSYVQVKRCPKMARKFFRIQADSLRHGREERVLGFCEACAKGKEKASNWKASYPNTVVGLSGNVVGLEAAQAPDPKTEGDRELFYLKNRLLTIMRQKNMVKYQNRWEEIFEDVVKQYSVESVMKA